MKCVARGMLLEGWSLEWGVAVCCFKYCSQMTKEGVDRSGIWHVARDVCERDVPR